MLRSPAALVALGLLTSAPAEARVADAAGDFLPTFTGSANDDLDVLLADVALTPTSFSFTATLNGAIGTTPGALYVFGLDRGQGAERFVAGSPSIGQGIFFDSVVVLRPDGTGTVADFINGNTQTNLAAGSVSVSGANLSGTVPLSLLPSTGKPLDQYTWNLWPRVGVGSNSQISDFAPDAANARVSAAAAAVPEPGTAALALTGVLPLAGMALRRRRRQRSGT